jgi:hypothetical protein
MQRRTIAATASVAVGLTLLLAGTSRGQPGQPTPDPPPRAAPAQPSHRRPPLPRVARPGWPPSTARLRCWSPLARPPAS